jgi:hypothetical protein
MQEVRSNRKRVHCSCCSTLEPTEVKAEQTPNWVLVRPLIDDVVAADVVGAVAAVVVVAANVDVAAVDGTVVVVDAVREAIELERVNRCVIEMEFEIIDWMATAVVAARLEGAVGVADLVAIAALCRADKADSWSSKSQSNTDFDESDTEIIETEEAAEAGWKCYLID